MPNNNEARKLRAWKPVTAGGLRIASTIQGPDANGNFAAVLLDKQDVFRFGYWRETGVDISGQKDYNLEPVFDEVTAHAALNDKGEITHIEATRQALEEALIAEFGRDWTKIRTVELKGKP